MPNQPKTKARSVRVPEDLWQAAKARAKARDESVTDVVVRALTRYVGKDPSVGAQARAAFLRMGEALASEIRSSDTPTH